MQPSRNYVKQGYVLTRSGHVLSRPCTPNEKKCEKVTRSVTFRATVPRIRSSQKNSETIEPFSLQRLKRQIHIHIYICRPLLVRGHQAARGFVIVSMLLSISCFKFSSFPCILHSLLVSSFLSKFYSCNVSLFLCCYRAHG